MTAKRYVCCVEEEESARKQQQQQYHLTDYFYSVPFGRVQAHEEKKLCDQAVSWICRKRALMCAHACVYGSL